MADNPFIVELAKILGEPGLNWDNGRSGLLKEKALCKARAAAAFMLKEWKKKCDNMGGSSEYWQICSPAWIDARAREIGVEIE